MRRWKSLMVAGSALLAAGCGVPADDHARVLDPSTAPYGILRDRETPPAGAHRVVVFLARDGRLIPVTRRIPERPTPASVLAALTDGPTASEQAQGLISVLPPDAEADVAGVAGGTVTVTLPAALDENARVDAALAFGQLVLTMTSLPDVSAVVFEHEGQQLQVPRGDGSLSTGPLRREDYQGLAGPP